jgi:hypothetical protein
MRSKPIQTSLVVDSELPYLVVLCENGDIYHKTGRDSKFKMIFNSTTLNDPES